MASAAPTTAQLLAAKKLIDTFVSDAASGTRCTIANPVEHELLAVQDALVRVKPNMSCCCVTWASALGDTSLVVNGIDYGKCSAPNVKLLVANARPAAFGHGTETVVDATVRSALSIDIVADSDGGGGKSNSLPLSDDWQWHLEQLMPSGRSYVAVPSRVHIYRKGNFFAEHVDTPHGNGHIGSIVCILPPDYDGGELVVLYPSATAGVEDERIDADGNPQFARFAFFYTDCPHRIEPVMWGTRVSLQWDVSVLPQSVDVNIGLYEVDDYNELDERKRKQKQKKASKKKNATAAAAKKDDGSDDAVTADASANKRICTLHALGLPYLSSIAYEWFGRFPNKALALALHHSYASSEIQPMSADMSVLRGRDRRVADDFRDGNTGLEIFLCPMRADVVKESDSRPDVTISLCASRGHVALEGIDQVLLMPLSIAAYDDWHTIYEKDGADFVGNNAMAGEHVYVNVAMVVRLERPHCTQQEHLPDGACHCFEPLAAATEPAEK